MKRIERLYLDTYKKSGGIKKQTFYTQRRALFMQLDQTINGMLEKQIFRRDVNISKIKSNLGLSHKSIVHQIKAQPGITYLDDFSKASRKVMHTTRAFSKTGYLAITLDIGNSALAIREACTTEPDSTYCSRTKYQQTGRTIGSISGGAGGGWLAYAGCSLIFAGPSAGTSLLWCGIVARLEERQAQN